MLRCSSAICNTLPVWNCGRGDVTRSKITASRSFFQCHVIHHTHQFPLPCHGLPIADINPRCSDVTRLSELIFFFLTFSAFSTPPKTYTGHHPVHMKVILNVYENTFTAVLTVHDHPMYIVCLDVLSTVGESSYGIVISVTSNAYWATEESLHHVK
jgi:hypothetical protein